MIDCSPPGAGLGLTVWIVEWRQSMSSSCHFLSTRSPLALPPPSLLTVLCYSSFPLSLLSPPQALAPSVVAVNATRVALP